MNPLLEHQKQFTRRSLFGLAATGVGSAALATLLQREGLAEQTGDREIEVPASRKKRDQPVGGLPSLPHFAPKAKRVIYLFQNGAPTHVDLFDWKPELQKRHKEAVPASYIQNRRFSTMTGAADGKLLLAPVEPFSQRGESGAWVSDFMPHTAKVADELCFVKSLHTEQVNHAPAINFNLSGAETVSYTHLTLPTIYSV